MKRIIIFLLLFAAIKVAGQTTGYLRFDTVRIMKQFGTCELYIINKTKDSLGLLTNVGGGLTQFKRSRMLNDSTLIIGLDTLIVHGTGGGGSGSVTSISQGFGITNTPNPITSTGTIKADTSQLATVTSVRDSAAAIRAIIGSGGTVNLDTSRTSTSATIIASGTDAQIKLVDIGSNKAGLMSPLDKLILDSMYLGLLADSTLQFNIGRGQQIAFVRGDSLFNKKLVDSGYLHWFTLNDSTLVGVIDTAGLRATIGAAANPGGSNTQLQYNNSSAFGGTAGATWDATNTGITISKSSLGVTQNTSSGFRLVNPTAAAAGAQQISPMIYLEGQGWKTTATAASQSTAYTVDVLPVQGSTAPDASLRVRQIINGGTAQTVGEFYPAGMHIGGNNGGGINFVGAPSIGNINSLNGLSFTTNSAPQQIGYSFLGNAGWAQTSSKSTLLNLAAGANGFFPTSGVATFAHLWLQTKVNQTGTASGISNGLLVEANLVSATDFRGIELTGYNSGYGFRSDSASVKHYIAGELNVGNITDQGSFKIQNTGGLYQNGLVKLSAVPSAVGTYTILTHQSASDSSVTQIDVPTLLAAGNIASGTYTATLTGVTNTDAVTFSSAHYYRQGNMCTVWIKLSCNPTATGVTDFGISLPFASALTAGGQVIGMGNCTSIPAQTITVDTDAANDRANASFIATDTNDQSFYISFSYQIL